jgi:putative sigma-54 modulation protein
MDITIRGLNFDLTDHLLDLISEKMDDSIRAFGNINPDLVQVTVQLSWEPQRYRSQEQLYRAEAKVSAPGKTIWVEEHGADVYAAVVKMKETLTRQIREWRERKIEGKRKGARTAKQLGHAEEVEE